MRIRKAVLPVAGLGTRVLPASKVVPKELLPLVDIAITGLRAGPTPAATNRPPPYVTPFHSAVNSGPVLTQWIPSDEMSIELPKLTATNIPLP